MTPSTTKLGSFIRTCRLNLHLRQAELASRARLTQSVVSMVEIGMRKYLSDLQLKRFAKGLHRDPAELLKCMPVKKTAKPTTALGKLIRSRREELGLTLESFARRIKLTYERAKYLELKKRSSLRYALVGPLAHALNLDSSNFAPFLGPTKKRTASKLGGLVRVRRKELGMSLSHLAEKLNVSRQFVNQIEFEQSSLSNSDDVIQKLAEALELNIGELEAVRPIRKLKRVCHPTLLGNFLVGRRMRLRLTQQQLGARAETWGSIVSNIERGKAYPNRNLMSKLARALECTIPPALISFPRSPGRPRIQTG